MGSYECIRMHLYAYLCASFVWVSLSLTHSLSLSRSHFLSRSPAFARALSISLYMYTCISIDCTHIYMNVHNTCTYSSLYNNMSKYTGISKSIYQYVDIYRRWPIHTYNSIFIHMIKYVYQSADEVRFAPRLPSSALWCTYWIILMNRPTSINVRILIDGFGAPRLVHLVCTLICIINYMYEYANVFCSHYRRMLPLYTYYTHAHIVADTINLHACSNAGSIDSTFISMHVHTYNLRTCTCV